MDYELAPFVQGILELESLKHHSGPPKVSKESMDEDRALLDYGNMASRNTLEHGLFF